MLSRFAPVFLLAAASFAQNAVSIEGRMVDDVRGEPIQNVRLVLTGSALLDPLVAKTDDNGRFGFFVPEGTYHLLTEKAGFFPLSAEATVPPNGKAELGAVTLSMKRSISGRLIWRNGEPVTEEMVMALRKQASGIRLFSAPVDDRGRFELGNLPAGRYEVGSFVSRSHGGRETVPVSQTVDLTDRLAYSGLELVYEERLATDTVDIEGRVLISPNVPAGTNVRVILTMPGVAGSYEGAAPAGEKFRIARVPAGAYQVVAMASGAARQEVGIQTLHVGTIPIRDWDVSIPPNTELTGTAMIEGESPIPFDGLLVAARTGNVYLTAMSRTDNGQFHLSSILPGVSYELSVDGLPNGTYVANVKQAKRTQTAEPFSVTAGEGPIGITLRNDGGRLTGQVPRKNNATAFVVLAPRNRSETRFFRTISTGLLGRFEITGIAPGDYELFAFERMSDYLGAATLDRPGLTRIAITVAPRASQSITVEMLN